MCWFNHIGTLYTSVTLLDYIQTLTQSPPRTLSECFVVPEVFKSSLPSGCSFYFYGHLGKLADCRYNLFSGAAFLPPAALSGDFKFEVAISCARFLSGADQFSFAFCKSDTRMERFCLLHFCAVQFFLQQFILDKAPG
jgi:hypothetical protein